LRAVRRPCRLTAPVPVRHPIDGVPILPVAVDPAPEMEALSRLLPAMVKQLLLTRPDVREACLNVQGTAPLGIDQTTVKAAPPSTSASWSRQRSWRKGSICPKTG
jgi:hypothetical protein